MRICLRDFFLESRLGEDSISESNILHVLFERDHTAGGGVFIIRTKHVCFLRQGDNGGDQGDQPCAEILSKEKTLKHLAVIAGIIYVNFCSFG